VALDYVFSSLIHRSLLMIRIDDIRKVADFAYRWHGESVTPISLKGEVTFRFKFKPLKGQGGKEPGDYCSVSKVLLKVSNKNVCRINKLMARKLHVLYLRFVRLSYLSERTAIL
jgi:hypothetical protein